MWLLQSTVALGGDCIFSIRTVIDASALDAGASARRLLAERRSCGCATFSIHGAHRLLHRSQHARVMDGENRQSRHESVGEVSVNERPLREKGD